ncbi:hypothetical protein EJ07DRAFT_135769 [Lizonia empirigonia]|nr:hypothetical protein EJ07DRAFT_135769 [Lizonia empirigonia]
MVENVFVFHQILGEDHVTFPFNIKDYQRYIFGDDRLAHRFGTDCAKAFIAHNSGAAEDVAVAVLSDYVPTATHSLRNHFAACLNRHLISTKANPVLKIDINVVEDSSLGRTGPQAGTEIYHLDRERVGRRTIIILNEVCLSQDREHRIRASLSLQHIENPVIFVYLAAVVDTSKSTSLESILSFIASPSLKEIEIVAQASTFIMNESFVQYILGRDDEEFCSFLRRQDDSFARLLLDYAIGGRYYDNDVYRANVKFLQWEVSTRESL